MDSSFPYDGPMELQGLTEAAPGVLYGSVSYGGLQIGHIFKYTIATHTLQHVVAVPTFLGDATNSIQGNGIHNVL